MLPVEPSDEAVQAAMDRDAELTVEMLTKNWRLKPTDAANMVRQTLSGPVSPDYRAILRAAYAAERGVRRLFLLFLFLVLAGCWEDIPTEPCPITQWVPMVDAERGDTLMVGIGVCF